LVLADQACAFNQIRMTSAPTEPDLGRLWGLHADGQHNACLRGAQKALDHFPENRDLLLIAASSQRHLRQVDDALATLDRLEALHPRFGRLHEERGLCHVQRMDAPRAIACLVRAITCNPALQASWRMLEGLYRLTHDPRGAAAAAEQIATLKNLPPEVVTAISRFSDGDLAEAEQIIRGFLRRFGDHP